MSQPTGQDLAAVRPGKAAAAGSSLSGIDALFAATTLQHGLTLVTRNARHMAASGVALFNPWNDRDA